MARRVLINGQWVEAPDAPALPPPAATNPAPAAPAAAPAPAPAPVASRTAAPTAAPGAATLNQAASVVGLLPKALRPEFLGEPNFGLGGTNEAAGQALERQPLAGSSQSSRGAMSDEDLALARRRAFLDGSDSISGLKAVRSLLSDEAAARGADTSAGGSIPAIKFLEGELAKRSQGSRTMPVESLAADEQEVWKQMAFPGHPIAQVERTAALSSPSAPAGEVPPTGTPAIEGGGLSPSQVARIGYKPETPQLAPQIPSGAGRAAVDAYMREGLSQKLREAAASTPASYTAGQNWQLTQQPIPAPREEPDRAARLAAFAARGEQPPTTASEAVLALGASNAFGTRGGQFKPGNTVHLGLVDPETLKPLNSTGFYSGVALNPDWRLW